LAGRYGPVVMDHFLNPRRVGELAGANACFRAENEACGDTLQLQLRIENGKITDARFRALGCTAAIAASSFLTEWLAGRPVEEAKSLTNDRLAEMLGGLPTGKTHCSVLAEEALAGCLADHQRRLK